MTALADWLRDKKMTHADFGRLIECDRSTVSKWAKGDRVPRRDEMTKIVRATDGAVTAADFYPEQDGESGLADPPETSNDPPLDMRAAG